MGRGRATSAYGRIKRLIEQEIAIDPNWQFARDVLRLIWEYRGYSLAILAVTVLQEVSALWPVSLLGQFIDRLPSGDLGNVVWLFLGASILAPGIMRGNIMLRHKMFYETDFQKRVEMTLDVCVPGASAPTPRPPGQPIAASPTP